MYPYNNPSIITKGLGLLKNLKWSELLDNTGKTLGVINQAIPVIYQAKPILTNAKTLFKIVGSINNNKSTNNNKEKIEKNNSPIFYI